MKNILFLILGLGLLNHTSAQQKSLMDSLRSKAEMVAYIKVTDLVKNGDMNLGTSEVNVKADLKHIYKGNPRTDGTISFVVIVRGDSHDWDRMKVGGDYIVFLKNEYWELGPNEPTGNPTLTLADQWLGILSWYKELEAYLLYY